MHGSLLTNQKKTQILPLTLTLTLPLRPNPDSDPNPNLRAEEREAEEGRAGGEEQRRGDEGRDAPTPDLQG